MKTSELQSKLISNPNLILLHVLPNEVFEAHRIAGSVNACIYEVAFLERVSALVPDKATRIVVYGSGDGSLDSRVAAETLREAGYGNVNDYSEGLSGWKAAGGALEGHGNLPQVDGPSDGIYRVDVAQSVLRWTGRNLFNHHAGTVRLADGEIRLDGGKLAGAHFRIDMKSIACEDIPDAALNALLIQHLKASDFFDVGNFPVAEFRADEAVPVVGCSVGTPNYQLQGTFTLRGVSKPMAFPVVVASAGDGRITGQGQLSFDRTDFGSIYGSGKFFRFLGKHVVNDHIDLHVKIHADLS